MKEITDLNVHCFCRTCLTELSEKSTLLGEKFNIHETEDLEELLNSCTAVPIDHDDAFPVFVCCQCYGKLKSSYDFRCTTMRSLRILTNTLKGKNGKTPSESESGIGSGHGCRELANGQDCVMEDIYGNKDWVQFQYECATNTTQTRNQEKHSDDIENAVARLRQQAFESSKGDLSEDYIEKSSDPIESEIKMETSELKNEELSSNSPDHSNEDEVLESIDISIHPEYATNCDNDNNEESCLSPPASPMLPKKRHRKKFSGLMNKISSLCHTKKITNKSARSSMSRKESTRTILTKSAPRQTQAKSASAKFQCELCPRRFLTLQNYEAHLRTHQGLKPFLCKECGRSFNRAAHLREHLREVHAPATLQYICSFEGCGKVFRREGSYKMHFRLKHTPANKDHEDKKYVCEDCGRTFKNITILKEHRYTHAPEDEYPFKCDECGKRFRSQRTYKEHQLRHAGIKNFECPHCGMKKTTRNELRTHVNYHTKEKQWPCPKCSNVFNSSANLGIHDRVVHKGIRRFSCRYCEQSFGKRDTLKHHEMRHTGEKPHECEVCDKRFIQVVALRAHMRTHNKENARNAKASPVTNISIRPLKGAQL